MPAGVEDRCGLGRRSPGHSVETSLLFWSEFSGSLGNIEHDRGGGPLNLIRQIASPARQPLDHVVGQDQESKSSLVDLEPLMIEVLHDTPPGKGKGRGRGRER